MIARAASLVAAIAGGLVLTLANAPAEDALWELAQQAYGTGDDETGNRRLDQLIESQPGDIDLAIRCLEKIYDHSDRAKVDSRWMRYVARRVAALERIGAISASAPRFREILAQGLEIGLQDRNLLETAERYDDLATRYPHDLYWQIARARGHQTLQLRSTRELFEALKQSADRNHPDPWTRERWEDVSDVLEGDFKSLPQPLLPPSEGSPLIDLDPDDPDGRWQQVVEQPISKVAGQADRLIGLALLGENVVPWRDMSGLIDPPRALDMHLRSRPADELAALRRTQALSFARELVPANPTPAKALALFRRYPWAPRAQHLLLRAANAELFAGHGRAALRSFEDLLEHSEEEAVLRYARSGRWVALSILGDRSALEAAVAKSDPGGAMTWMGEATTAGELGAKLLASAPTAEPEPSPVPLGQLALQMLRIPPVAPWPGGGHAGSSVLDMRVVGSDLLLASRNHLALYPLADPRAPRWAQPRPPLDDDRNHRGLFPGYFRPEVEGGTIYTRWGLRAVPTGIAAFDLQSGRALWLQDSFGSEAARANLTPLGDPAASDGLLYVLLRDPNGGQKLQLACVESATQNTLFRTTIAQAGRSSDLIANLERANDTTRTFGNRVTPAGGAVYVNTNSGLVARCDARDGRPDWLHYYPTNPGAAAGALGCAPILDGQRVICMPRDTGRVFALDAETGRLLWDNPLVLGVEALGMVDGSLLVRGQSALVALDPATGQARWHTPLPDRPIGRAQRIGSSVFIADPGGITEFDARDGTAVARRVWDAEGGIPLSFHIHRHTLFAVADEPAENRGIALAEALNPDAPAESTALVSNLQRHWRLPRSDAAVFRAPSGAPLADHAFLLSEGILECIEISPRGALRWRRFVDAHQPAFHMMGEHLLLVSGGGATRHISAYNGRDGELLWESEVPGTAGALLECGGVGVLHDSRSILFAFDPVSGERRWERHVAFGHLTIPHWDGEKLHVFQTSMGRGALHFVIDASNGQTIAEHDIELGRATGKSYDGQLIDNGYYEVAFEPVAARYFRLVMLSEINGQGWASAAELHVAGPDGANLDRSTWRAHYTDSFEPRSRMSTKPENVFDGDRSSWWHSQWINGIPKHPHELQIDLGKRANFKALRYLPAVIINNNGMIADYELYASDDAENWGDPIAAGTMVKRLFIDRAAFTDNGLVFESRNRQTGKRDIYGYRLDGSQAVPLAPSHEFIAAAGAYALARGRGESDNDVVVVLRPDDPSYRFELGKGVPFDQNRILIDGDRLCLASHRVVIADLAKREFIVPPSTEQRPQDRQGLFVRTGDDTLLKFLNSDGNGTAVASIDLATGAVQQDMLAAQTDPPRDLSTGPTPRFDRVLLMRDDFGVSAWSSAR